MGDPGGVGPEVILKTLCEPDVTSKVDLCVIGPAVTIEDISRVVGISPIFRQEAEPADWTWRKAPFVYPLEGEDFVMGRPARENGAVSLQALDVACDLVMGGFLDGIVTAPISKEAWHMTGCKSIGHTDYLAHLTGQETVMMMVTGTLRVAMVTGHTPLKKVCEDLNHDRIVAVIRLTHEALVSRFGLSEPRIAMAAVNPHAGEAGLCGDEERSLLRPAMETCLAEGLPVQGPVPADVVFRQALEGQFDAVISPYHDQGLIPVKLLDLFSAVNVTLGLPFIRTSPGHGTAFDIAGRGTADHRGMMQAVTVAESMGRRILFP
jgi:4-hydroxythreonine-4-phosphate dehydrogenase